MCECHRDDCRCMGVESLQQYLRSKRGRVVGVSSTSGDVKVGQVQCVEGSVLTMVEVMALSPACPCVPVYASRAVVAIDQIADVLEHVQIPDQTLSQAMKGGASSVRRAETR